MQQNFDPSGKQLLLTLPTTSPIKPGPFLEERIMAAWERERKDQGQATKGPVLVQ